MTTREEIIAAAREAGFNENQWNAMTYESGPYDITNATYTLEKFYTIAHEAGAASRDAELVEAQATTLTMRDSIWEALQQRDKLCAEIESLKQDAERYQWLINYMASARTDLDDDIVGACSTDNPEHLDAFIKKAMKGEEG